MTGGVDRLVGRPIIGTPAEIGVAIRTATAAGRLVRTDPPRPLGDGRIVVEAVFREPAPAPVRPPRSRPTSPRPPRRVPARTWWWAASVLAGFALVGGLAWLLAVAVAWVLTHWAPILAALWLSAGLAAALGRAFGGRHCPGCDG